jgi:hypothetical protein
VCKSCCEARLSAQPEPLDLRKAKAAVKGARKRAGEVERAVESAAERAGERRQRRKDRGGWIVGVWWS